MGFWRSNWPRATALVAGCAMAVLVSIVAVVVGPLASRPAGSLPPPASSPSRIADLPTLSAPPVVSPSPAPASPVVGGRYPGGLPRTLDGQPVYVGPGALAQAGQVTDATSFLVGGWLDYGSLQRCAVEGTVEPASSDHLLLPACANNLLNDWERSGEPWPIHDNPWSMTQATLPLPRQASPSVVRVHQREGELVVDAVVWSADTQTQTSPLSIDRALNLFPLIRHLTPASANAPLTRVVAASGRDCPGPWPADVFDLRGDPRFALLAVFPTAAARAEAEAAVEASTTCPIDPRVARPGKAEWVAEGNAVVLVYGDDAARTMDQGYKLITDPESIQGQAIDILDFPPLATDESYEYLRDFLAARVDGYRVIPALPAGSDSGALWQHPDADLLLRYTDNALSFQIGPEQTVTPALVGSTVWQQLANVAAPGTARLYVVEHPELTSPALREETFVVYRLKNPTAALWETLLLRGSLLGD